MLKAPAGFWNVMVYVKLEPLACKAPITSPLDGFSSIAKLVFVADTSSTSFKLIVAVALMVSAPSVTEMSAVITGLVSKSNRLGSMTVNSPVPAFMAMAPIGLCAVME